MKLRRSFAFALFAIGAASAWALVSPARWTEQRANQWYAKQPWLVGANLIPSNAINQFEMFQAATFDPSTNDRELGLAESSEQQSEGN